MVTERKNNLLMQIIEDEYLIAKNGYSKVIFKIENSDDAVLLKNYRQSTCDYNDFIDSFEYICEYLFDKGFNKILTKRPCFDKELFINDGYTFDGDFIMKSNEKLIKRS